MKDIEEVKAGIRGPVYPIIPAFHENGVLDLDSVKDYVKYLNSFDVCALMVTAGTSRFNLLTDGEIKSLNEAVVEANQDKALTILANPMTGSTDRAIEYALHAQEVGGDCMLLYYPERYYDDESIFNYFKDVADNSDIGLMLHGIPMRNAYTGVSPKSNYSLKLCERLCSLDNFVGMKEESGSEAHRDKLASNLADRMVFVVAGASMRMYLSSMHFGVQAYLVGVGSFKPEIEEEFYRYVKAGEFGKSFQIVKKYEEPFFDVAFPMGWHVAMREGLRQLELTPGIERPPLKQANNKEVDAINQIFKSFGWI